jgi:hypothetical protein
VKDIGEPAIRYVDTTRHRVRHTPLLAPLADDLHEWFLASGHPGGHQPASPPTTAATGAKTTGATGVDASGTASPSAHCECPLTSKLRLRVYLLDAEWTRWQMREERRMKKILLSPGSPLGDSNPGPRPYHCHPWGAMARRYWGFRPLTCPEIGSYLLSWGHFRDTVLIAGITVSRSAGRSRGP